MKDYEILAKDYEALNPKEEVYKQQGFFQKLIAKYASKTCLDCACGPGFQLHMLSELGLKCYGSDLSTDMLAVAMHRAEGRDIVFKQEDYRSLQHSWDMKFDMIICMANSIRHMLTEDDTVAALSSMYERLNDKGILVIDNGYADNLINARPKVLPGRIHREQAFYFILEYPNDQEIIFNILQVKKTPDSFDHSFESIRLNAMKKADYERCLGRLGFKSIEYYGDFDCLCFNPESSNRMIAVAQK